MKKTFLFSLNIFVILLVSSCATLEINPVYRENERFLDSEPVDENDLYHVVLMSDRYQVSQKQYSAKIVKNDDISGDEYFQSEIAKHDKIDEARQGIVKVWLYPDSGKIMKVRFIKSTYLRELDKIILDDIQRWSFSFPEKDIFPAKFNVLYRVVLRKNISDAKIREEVDKEKEEKEKKEN